MATIVSRQAWGARPARSITPMRSFTSGWIGHWLGTPHPKANNGPEAETRILRETQRYHQDTRGYVDIAYSHAAGQSGTLYECRGFGVQGGHTEGHNSTGMAVVFLIGEGQTASAAALKAAAELFREGERRGYPPHRVRPHRGMPGAATACPGDQIAAWTERWSDLNGDPTMTNPYEAQVNEALQLLKEHAGYDGDLDGWFGQRALDALHRLKNSRADGPQIDLAPIRAGVQEAANLLDQVKAALK